VVFFVFPRYQSSLVLIIISHLLIVHSFFSKGKIVYVFLFLLLLLQINSFFSKRHICLKQCLHKSIAQQNCKNIYMYFWILILRLVIYMYSFILCYSYNMWVRVDVPFIPWTHISEASKPTSALRPDSRSELSTLKNLFRIELK